MTALLVILVIWLFVLPFALVAFLLAVSALGEARNSRRATERLPTRVVVTYGSRTTFPHCARSREVSGSGLTARSMRRTQPRHDAPWRAV